MTAASAARKPYFKTRSLCSSVAVENFRAAFFEKSFYFDTAAGWVLSNRRLIVNHESIVN